MRWALLAAWWAAILLSTYATLLYWRRVRGKPAAELPQGVVLIIPIKAQPGAEPAIRTLLEACLHQLGTKGRLIVAVQSETDPAAAAIPPGATLVVAGPAPDTRGQKVHNLLHALETLTPHDRFVVFADADLVPAPDWLAQLLRPLALGRAPIASGYRWILPADDALPSRLAALMDWSIATAARSRRWNVCWGGSTALTREALDRIDLPHQWHGALLDDLVLTAAARSTGLAIHAPHHTLMVSPVHHDWHSLAAFVRRQYLMARVHSPRHWCLAGLALATPVAGTAAALGAGWPGLLTIAAALGLQQARARLRVAIARRVLQPGPTAASAALIRTSAWLLPAAHILHFALWLASAFGRQTVWAGTRYRLRAPDHVEVVR